MGLPPGPRLSGSVQAVLMLRHGLRFLTACQRRYGSVFTLHVAGFGHMVYLSDPAAIKTVFAGNPSVFHAGEANSMLAGLLGDSSLLLIDDDVHRDASPDVAAVPSRRGRAPGRADSRDCRRQHRRVADG